jgi:biopolymer transport protein ExbD
VIVTALVFVVLVVGVIFGVRALVEAVGSRAETAPTASATPTPTPAGFTYTSAEYGYTVEFPSEPTENSSTVPVGDAQVPVTSAVWEGGTRSLVSTGATYPAGALADVNASLKSSLDGIVANTVDAQLVSSDPVTLAGIPAVEASISVPSGNLVVVIAIDGDIQYQLVAAGFDKATADGFFASFHPA